MSLHASRYLCAKDKRVTFVEMTHKYYVDWKDDGNIRVNDISVTGIVKSQFNQFDADLVIKKMRRPNIKGKKRYNNMTSFEIKLEWKKAGDEACLAGSAIHSAIEDYYNMRPVKTDAVEYKQFLEYASMMVRDGAVPYRAEWIVFSDAKSKMVGTIDMTYVTKSDGDTLHLIIVDWKRTKALKTFSREMGIDHCSKVPDANFFRYTLQLNLYKYILEKTYGGVIEYQGRVYDRVVVDSMWIVVLHPRLKTFARFTCPTMTPIISSIVNDRCTQK